MHLAHIAHIAHVALGANLADPVTQVNAAIAELNKIPQSRLLRASSLYRTEPIGIDGQPDFINAVAVLETRLTPQVLLEFLFEIEAQFGRSREFHMAPRTLDLDLLLFDAQIIDSQQLQLPHPRMHLRAFVIVPLVEISPDCSIPGRGLAAAWLPTVSQQNIERLKTCEL